MILWLLALPLAAALLLLLIGRWRLFSAPLAAAMFLAMAIFSVAVVEPQTADLAGRALNLQPEQAVLLTLCFTILAVLIWATYRAPRLVSAYALCLAGASTMTASMVIRNMTLSTLLLGIGVVLAVMLTPDEHVRSPHTGMQVLVQMVLPVTLLIFASWALEGSDIEENADLLRYGGMLFALGMAMLLGLAPFSLWVAPLFRQGNILAILMLRVVLPTILIGRLLPMIQAANWPGGEAFFSTVVFWGGMLTVAAGSVTAISQRTLGTALAYTTVADLGLVMVSLGLGMPESVEMGIAHLRGHIVGVALVCLALQSIRLCVDQDDVDHLWGVAHRAPLSMVALGVGGLSLVGFPGTAGFMSRFVIYRMLAVEYRPWALVLLALSIGPAWAILRCIISAMRPATRPDPRREMRWPGILGLPLALLLLVPYLLARFPAWVPTAWLRSLIGF